MGGIAGCPSSCGGPLGGPTACFPRILQRLTTVHNLSSAQVVMRGRAEDCSSAKSKGDKTAGRCFAAPHSRPALGFEICFGL
jgi:hypothetical protein